MTDTETKTEPIEAPEVIIPINKPISRLSQLSKLSPEDVDNAKQWRLAGNTYAAIGRELGINPTNVKRLLGEDKSPLLAKAEGKGVRVSGPFAVNEPAEPIKASLKKTVKTCKEDRVRSEYVKDVVSDDEESDEEERCEKEVEDFEEDYLAFKAGSDHPRFCRMLIVKLEGLKKKKLIGNLEFSRLKKKILTPRVEEKKLKRLPKKTVAKEEKMPVISDVQPFDMHSYLASIR